MKKIIIALNAGLCVAGLAGCTCVMPKPAQTYIHYDNPAPSFNTDEIFTMKVDLARNDSVQKIVKTKEDNMQKNTDNENQRTN